LYKRRTTEQPLTDSPQLSTDSDQAHKTSEIVGEAVREAVGTAGRVAPQEVKDADRRGRVAGAQRGLEVGGVVSEKPLVWVKRPFAILPAVRCASRY
jgi:hypothetical protein